MITGFNHSGFVVKNIDRQVDFYQNVLGLKVIRKTNPGPEGSRHTGIPDAYRALVFLGKEEDGHLIELVQFIKPQITDDGHVPNTYIGAAHICFNVTNLKELYRSMVEKKMKFVTEPIIRTTESGVTTTICYGQDPEGNWLEFIEKTTV